MTSDVPIDPTINDTFRQMSALIYAGADSGSIHQSLVESARQLIEGCDRASLLVRTRDRYVTAASTDDIARRIDQIELEVGEGPCVDAIVSEAYQHDADLTDATTPWPRFTERIVAETPVRSAIGYRLLLDGDKVGALNVFSDTPGALTSRSADVGAVIASFASVALMAIRRVRRPPPCARACRATARSARPSACSWPPTTSAVRRPSSCCAARRRSST